MENLERMCTVAIRESKFSSWPLTYLRYANVCSLQISLGSISSFMRVYNSTAGVIKSENIAEIPFFLRFLYGNTAVLNFTMLSKSRIL